MNLLTEKDSIIRRIQSELQMRKAYGVKSTTNRDKARLPNTSFDNETQGKFKSLSLDEVGRMKIKSASTRNIKSTNTQIFSSDRLQLHNTYNTQDTQIHIPSQYDGLTRDQLLSIIENHKQSKPATKEHEVLAPSPISDLERFELQLETPHEEICQLQNYYMEMVTEVDRLKYTITQLRKEHDDTTRKLKQKDVSINILANEIQSMKQMNLSTLKEIDSMHKDHKKPSSRNVKGNKPLVTSNISNQIVEEVASVLPEGDLEDIPEELVTCSSCSDIDSLLTERNGKMSSYVCIPSGTPKQEYNTENGSNSFSKELVTSDPKRVTKSVDEIRREKFSKLVEEMEKTKHGIVKQ